MKWDEPSSDLGNPYASNIGVNTGGSDVRSKMRAPGIAMVAVGILGMLGMAGYFVLTLIGISMEGPGFEPPAEMNEAEKAGYYVGFYGMLTMMPLAALLQLVVIFAGIGLINGKWKLTVLAGSVISLIPGLSACCVLGIPIGIWSLVVLSDPRVSAVFKSNS